MPEPAITSAAKTGKPGAGARRPAGKPGTPSSGPLGRRVAGFPLYVWLGGLVLAIGVGLYIRHRSAGSSSSSPTAAAPLGDSGSSGGGSGGSGDSSAGGSSFDPFADPFYTLADSLNGLTGVLGAGSFGGVDNSTLGTTPAGVPVAQGGSTTTANTSASQPSTSQDTAPVYSAGGSTPAASSTTAGGGAFPSGSGIAKFAIPGVAAVAKDPALTPLPATTDFTIGTLHPGETIQIDPYKGPSYIQPGANPAPAVATDAAQAKGNMGSHQAI